MTPKLRPLLSLAGLLVALLAPLLISTAAHATPVTVPNGQTAVLNVDMTGLTPGPIYDRVVFGLTPEVSQSGSLAGSVISFHGGLDGQGPAILTNPFTDLFSLFALELANAAFKDGLFSILISVVEGPLVFEPRVQGTVITPRGSFLTDVVLLTPTLVDPGITVPEPSSLALVGLAVLLGATQLLGSARRQRDLLVQRQFAPLF